MCTAVSAGGASHYFGRNLDFEDGFGEKITVTPRNYPFRFGDRVTEKHYAMIGMALPAEGYPLYFDATNEKGLSMAGLLFAGEAVYRKPMAEKENIPSFQLIPRILAQCKNVEEAENSLKNINITDTAFSESLPPSPLHWMVADKEKTLVVEQTKEGLSVYQNPTGVLTNSPGFSFQMQCLSQFMGLSPKEPENRFAPGLNLTPTSRGVGTLGLPGDLSSPSRYVRACFTKLNSVWSGKEGEDVSQFFHILNSVSQTMGCNKVGEKWEITRYSSCCNTGKGIYYYTTYHNSRISAVDMSAEKLDGGELILYDPADKEDVFHQNSAEKRRQSL